MTNELEMHYIDPTSADIMGDGSSRGGADSADMGAMTPVDGAEEEEELTPM